MSLRVWLPLNGNLDNQGLSDLTVTNNGATVDNSGKIGKCYSFGTSSSYLTLSNDAMNKCTTECSLSFWLNITSWNTSYATYFQAGLGGAPWNHYIFGVLRIGTASNLCFTISNGSTASNASYTTPNLELSTWYHLTFVYKTGHCLIYINGELYKDYTTTIVPNFSGITKTTVGACNSGGYHTNCKMNDVRVYDHALSPKEIKELSKGLVCHYTLSNPYDTDNLFVNGYGENGQENWTSANFSTTEIPPNQPNIKASYHSGTMTQEYVPISHSTTYTLSVYLKAKGSGSCYPSLFTYDVDKKFIQNYHCPSGFSNSYKTTLAQPLKKGDTVVYATDLSAWTTGDNYWCYVAIFGYKDSTGHVYPDMGYTADSPTFGTKTDKSHIDKTNNTITLNAPFTGEDRPAGTTICQATAGGTYYYPFGGINSDTIPDWVYKTAVLNPSTIPRLQYAKYVRYQAYSYAYHAGLKMVDNSSSSSNVVHDCSGYGNDGIRNGYISCSSDTSRYSLSTVFTNGKTDYISAQSLPAETKTVSCWLKCPLGNVVAFIDYNSHLAIGIHNSTAIISYTGTTSGGTGSRVAIDSNWKLNEWNHIVVVATSFNTRDVYLNTIKLSPSSVNYWGHTTDNMMIGRRSLESAYYSGQLSDFRAYATALSADDIKELYEVGSSIDKDGNTFAYEYIEN